MTSNEITSPSHDFSSEDSTPKPEPKDFSHENQTPLSQPSAISEDLQRLARGARLPFYAAIGFTDTVVSKVEKTFFKARDEVKNSDRSFTQQASDRFQERKEKLIHEGEQWDSDKILNEPAQNIGSLSHDFRHSAENLLRGFIQRGHAVTKSHKYDNKG